MHVLRHKLRSRNLICLRCARKQHSKAIRQMVKVGWAESDPDKAVRKSQWEARAQMIKSGAQQSMLEILEERGLVKDIAGGREGLNHLLTEKPVGVYVGIDPTAPSLHVGHLIPLMALYWMYLYGYEATTLVGGGTVKIGDPSGRSTARSPQRAEEHHMSMKSIKDQLIDLWTNVKCLGIKHQFAHDIDRKRQTMNNHKWMERLGALELFQGMGSGMRLGEMLSRDSVRLRLKSSEGMAMSEFSYPLFQAYDWWHLNRNYQVQLQIGGSDQFGNICAGMDAISRMQRTNTTDSELGSPNYAPSDTYGLTTPLLTTSSGEKFGKSTGNAIWLDEQMLSSFHLYQYFLRTSDDEVERYLKLFTFLSLDEIKLLMSQHNQDESKRTAQHSLAKELVELVHGAKAAREAERQHKETFSHGTATFPLGVLRSMVAGSSSMKNSPEAVTTREMKPKEWRLMRFKRSFIVSSPSFTTTLSMQEEPKRSHDGVVTLPVTMLKPGAFPHILYAAGLTSSKSEAHRLIANEGAYVLLPNSGTVDNPRGLKWATIKPDLTADPHHFLVDWEILTLRSGKSKVQVCHIVTEEEFRLRNLSYPGQESSHSPVPESVRTGSN